MTADRNRAIFGISIPRKILRKIDNDRGAIPRSRFLLKLIEIAYNTDKIKPQIQFFTILRDKNSLPDESLGGLTSDKIIETHKVKPCEYD